MVREYAVTALFIFLYTQSGSEHDTSKRYQEMSWTMTVISEKQGLGRLGERCCQQAD